MRRIADLCPGGGKADARDAYVIADAAPARLHTLRRVGTDDETLAGLTVLAGYDDDDLAGAVDSVDQPSPGRPLFQSRWCAMLMTLPSGARTKNRRTPHCSVVIGLTIS